MSGADKKLQPLDPAEQCRVALLLHLSVCPRPALGIPQMLKNICLPRVIVQMKNYQAKLYLISFSLILHVIKSLEIMFLFQSREQPLTKQRRSKASFSLHNATFSIRPLIASRSFILFYRLSSGFLRLASRGSLVDWLGALSKNYHQHSAVIHSVVYY